MKVYCEIQQLHTFTINLLIVLLLSIIWQPCRNVANEMISALPHLKCVNYILLCGKAPSFPCKATRSVVHMNACTHYITVESAIAEYKQAIERLAIRK